MQAHLLLLAILALLAIIAWRPRQRGSTPTEVAGDLVTLQALKADIAEERAELRKAHEAFTHEFAAVQTHLVRYAVDLAEIKRNQLGLRTSGDETARELKTIAQVLDLHFAAERRRSEQQVSEVCSTGSHAVRRIR